MKIDGREIGAKFLTYVVAELSASHNHSLDRAMTLIDIAKQAGADAVKFQAYTPGGVSLFHPRHVISGGPWKGKGLYGLYEKAHTPRHMLTAMFAYARDKGITAFATPCTRDDVDFLEKLDCPAYKIASLDIVNTWLIERLADTGKPIIISTANATDDMIIDAESWAGGNGHPPVIMHCVGKYPCPPRDTWLRRISGLPDLVEFSEIGFSDHTLGVEPAIMAIALGAVMVEKHITISRGDGGPDDFFATEPAEFIQFVRAIRRADEVKFGMDEEVFDPAFADLAPSIYAIEDIEKGAAFTLENARIIRPSGGLPPLQFGALLHARSNCFIRRGEPIRKESVSHET